MLDTSRKIILHKDVAFQGHRILDIANSSIPWVDTHLSTIAVIARGIPDIKIFMNKNSENKFYHIYTIKGISLNAENDGGVKEETNYLDFPCKIEISKESLFMLVTTYGGDVHFLKLPEPLNPIKAIDPAQPVQTEVVATPAQEPTAISFMKPEIDHIAHKDLKFADLLEFSVKNKELPKQFIDPFDPKNEVVEEEVNEKDPKAKKGKEVVKEPEEPPVDLNQDSGPKIDYKVGKKKFDGDMGDASYLFRHRGPMPHAYFTRSLFCAQVGSHSSLQYKQVMITTGFVIAYQKLKIVEQYFIQKASKNNVPKNFTYDHFQQEFMRRKNEEKKKKENTLATLIKTAKEDMDKQNKEKQPEENQEHGERKPSLVFKTLFDIESSEYLDYDENAQLLAVGMVNGGTIVYDICVGFEKWVLECHGGPVSSISFYKDVSIITGSNYGSVYINSLEERGDDETLKFNQSNCMDENIPVAKVLATDYGIGLALDVRGNVRLYDMIRHKKIAKVQDRKPKEDISLKLLDTEMKSAFRIFPRVCMGANNDQIIIVDNTEEFSPPNEDDQPKEEVKEEDPKKKGKAPAEGEPEIQKEPEEEKIITDFDILKNNSYEYDSNQIRQTMKPSSKLISEMDEKTYFLISKSSICIYRLEDLVFSIYPHLAGIKRKGINTKEVFTRDDPDKMTSAKNSKDADQSNLQAPFAGDAYKSTYSKKTHKSNSSVHSGRSGYGNLHSQGFDANLIANFAVKAPTGQGDLKRSDGSLNNESQHDFGVPTLEILNPELYKENLKKQKVVKDCAFESLKHIKERYGYHEMRAQRAQKRSEEIQKELENKREEEMLRKRKRRLIT